MKKYFTAFQMTQSMFCSLPFPCRRWEEECRPYMMLFLPVVGLEIGVLWITLEWLLQTFQAAAPIFAFFMMLFPYLLTGFMHLDGFMDVTDAVFSWRSLEKRREILKDSHVGSFSVIWCIFLILAGYASFSAVSRELLHPVLALVPLVSRCLSSLAVMNGKPMDTSQYAKLSYPKWHSAIMLLMAAGGMGFAFFCFGKTAVILLGEAAAYAFSWKKASTSLQGMNGDISGYCISVSELCAVILLALI